MARRVTKIRGFSTVLAAVDFSRDSRTALRTAAAVAAADEGSLTVLYVSDPMLLAAAAAGYDPRVLEESASRELGAFIRRAVPPRTLARLTLSTEIRIGSPAREIARRAREGRFDLLVLGTRGLNGARRLLLGSTTASVLRQARVPVLTIPGAIGRRPAALQWPPQRLLGALELGPHTRADAAAYAAVASALGVRLTLLHIVAVPPAPDWYGSTRRRTAKGSPAAVQQALQRLRERYADVVDDVVVLAGDPPTGIHAAASARRGALILMTLRSRPGLFGSRAGSVAYEVLCRAAAPVLALPT